jgi:hypothetical protein
MPFDLVAGLGGPVDIDATDSWTPMRRSNEFLNPSASEIGLYKCPGVRLVGFIVADSSLATTASGFFTSEIACFFIFYGCHFFFHSMVLAISLLWVLRGLPWIRPRFVNILGAT